MPVIKPSSNDLQRAVIVAVIVVDVVQMAVHQVIEMIPMRHRRVSACRSVDVIFIMAIKSWTALGGIRAADGHGVVLQLSGLRVFQMTIAKIIHMTLVSDAEMVASCFYRSRG